jgi:hypothetical protein
MNLDIDSLISSFQNLTGEYKSEIGEQEVAGAATAPAGGGTSSGGKSPKKWESGVARGKANQVAITKWESGRKFGKTYMNDPKYVWKSDRQMGKTGGSDYA